MYENQSFNTIIERKKEYIRNNHPGVDAREGSIAHIALAPTALESSEVYAVLDGILQNGFATTASRPFLELIAKERGLSPYPAKKAILRGEFTPVDINIPIGERFRRSTLNYSIIEKISDGVYELECETAGVIGGSVLGDLIPIGNVNGLQTAKLTAVLIPGRDAQETEDFRKEYFDSFETSAFGGNIADYVKWVNDLPGVGGLKVYPVWDGAKTVKIVFIDSSFGKPSNELVTLTQNAIDPVGHQGEGIGIAPIWHIVTVEGVENVTINITATFTYEVGWSFEAAQSYIYAAIEAYLLELRTVWEETINYSANTDTGLIVRISQIETRLLDLTGILDIGNTVINGVANNLVLSIHQVPILGVISGS